MKNPIIWIVVVLVILGGGYWFYTQSNLTITGSEKTENENTAGTYAYTCDNGTEFTMMPKEDLSSITIMPAGARGSVSSSVVLAHDPESEVARFIGSGVTFVGAGEEVTLTVSGTTTQCNPKPNPDMAPWNWGDAGDGAGSVKPDVTLVVSESIQGKWQSTDDTKFVREFKADGTFVDWHDNEMTDDGTYNVFASVKAPKVAVTFPISADSVYVQLVTEHDRVDTMNFKVGKLTPEELQLVYMDRGGVLNFKLVKSLSQ